MPLTQDNRPYAVETTLGKDVLLFWHMRGIEELGRPFSYELEMLSEDPGIMPNDILGTLLTVRVELPTGDSRYFNGYVTSFEAGDSRDNFAVYRAVVRPWLWLLTRTSDCRIFQEKKAPDIIKDVFREKGFTDFEDKLTGSYREWVYCVQYRETDFNFVCRLMENEGIYFFFKHEQGKHTLVLADSGASHETLPNYDEVPYFPPDSHFRRERDHISQWSVTQGVQTGEFAMEDYDFEKPSADLTVKSKDARQHEMADFPMYDYPGGYVEAGDGNPYVQTRLQELLAQHEQVQGVGTARGLSTGSLFSLSGFDRAEQNREYLITGASYEMQTSDYESQRIEGPPVSFTCRIGGIPNTQQYRPPRVTRRPFVQGPQTAIVVGPSGDEIYTDKYGRVKVQFFWDRYGKHDENSSCWLRVGQIWAGKTWGGIHIPRIGQEVIVDFLEGNPDRPIITGRVYNAEQMPPYELPANMTQSGIKSRSTLEGTEDNFNELRFEDKIGEEEIYFHAEKDFNRVVENNDTLKVGFEDKEDGDQTIEIHNNQTLTIGNSESKDGSQTSAIYKDRTTTLETGNDTLEVKEGDQTVTVKTGDQTVTVKTGDQTVTITAGKSTTKAGTSIELKVGGSSVKIEPAKITLKSTMIEVNASAMLTLKGGVVQIN